jgi:stage II sporulation protein D
MQVDGKAQERLHVDGAPTVEVRVLGEKGDSRIVRRYRGALEVTPAGAALLLVNQVAERDYLAGTVALESEGSAPEALRAQAVVARTLSRHGARHDKDGYDLCDLTHCQVYKGEDGATPAAREAVQATDGEVLAQAGGRPAEVYFSSRCGGATADAGDVWPVVTEPYLRSVPCAPCKRRGGWPWRSSLRLSDLDRALDTGGKLRSVTVIERGAGGTVRRVRLDGTDRVVTGEDFRIAAGRALGWNAVPSNRFTVQSTTREFIQLTGTGRGHLVGLCTAGAADLAHAGLDHRAILRRYFPGTDVVIASGQ